MHFKTPPVARGGHGRDYRKLALSGTVLVGAATALIGGAFATFTDSVSAGPQTITSGTVKLAVGPVNDAATGATSIAAGDTIAREADLNSTGGTIANKEITLKFGASPSSLLDTDPTNGLQVAIKACSVAWTRKVESGPPAFKYTCSGTESTVKIGGAETASVSSLTAHRGGAHAAELAGDRRPGLPPVHAHAAVDGAGKHRQSGGLLRHLGRHGSHGGPSGLLLDPDVHLPGDAAERDRPVMGGCRGD